MGISFRFYLENQEWRALLRAHKRWLRSFRPTDMMGRLLYQVAQGARDAAEVRSHKITGALSMSHRVIFSPQGVTRFSGAESVVYVDALTNPMHGKLTTEYAETEEARGGEHAFYELVVTHDAAKIIEGELDSTFGREFFRG